MELLILNDEYVIDAGEVKRIESRLMPNGEVSLFLVIDAMNGEKAIPLNAQMTAADLALLMQRKQTVKDSVTIIDLR